MIEEQTRKNLGIEPAVLVEIYRQMSRIHEVDKAIRSNQSAGRFQFAYWPMTGQEAIPATLASLTDSAAWNRMPNNAVRSHSSSATTQPPWSATLTVTLRLPGGTPVVPWPP